KQELDELIVLENHEYSPFADLFYDSPSTQHQFEHLCSVNLKIQPQYFLSILSPFSTLLGTKVNLKVPVLGKFRGTINTGLVGESGNGKSIVSSILLDPLYRLQTERLETYQKQENEYNQLVERWEKQHPDERGYKPRRDEYVTSNDGFLIINEYTREGIVKNHKDNPNGLLIHQEELVAIQRAQNMYRQGKGDDRQFLNNLYDNKSIARSLKSERITVKETAVAITGGYQPDVILGEMGDLSDPDGQWARFNFICGQEKPVHTDLNQPVVDVSDILYNLYKKALNAPPVDCYLDKAGQDLLQDFINEMEKKRWESLQPGWRAILSKASGEVVRIALDLHSMNCLLNDRPIDPLVPAIAILTAIKSKRFFLSQIEIIRSLGFADPSRENGLAAVYSQILKIAKRMSEKTKYLTVRMVQGTHSGVFEKLKSSSIQRIFKDLAAMGKAKLVKYKRSLALEISSLLDGDGNKNDTPISPNNGDGNKNDTPISPSNGDGNSTPINKHHDNHPPAQTNNVGNGHENLEKQSSSNLIPSTPVLLGFVGDLLGNIQPLEPSDDNTLTSFVGFVGTVGRYIQCNNTLLFTPPTRLTLPTINQSETGTGFESDTNPAQQSQQTREELKEAETSPDIDWLLKLQWSLENSESGKTENEWIDLVAEMEKVAHTIENFVELYPDYWDRVW
ncbi:MAG: DUF3987 domain-containing protein, partial [Crocosphaera sp.]